MQAAAEDPKMRLCGSKAKESKENRHKARASEASKKARSGIIVIVRRKCSSKFAATERVYVRVCVCVCADQMAYR